MLAPIFKTAFLKEVNPGVESDVAKIWGKPSKFRIKRTDTSHSPLNTNFSLLECYRMQFLFMFLILFMFFKALSRLSRLLAALVFFPTIAACMQILSNEVMLVTYIGSNTNDLKFANL